MITVSSLFPELQRPSAAPIYAPATDYPVGQKLALMLLRRTRGNLHDVVIAHLNEMGVTAPDKADWRAMIEAGRIERRDNRLQLTVQGVFAAGEIARDLARKLQIHFIATRHSRPGVNPSARCTCGWSSGTRRGPASDNAVARWVAAHRDAVAAGTWQPVDSGAVIDRAIREFVSRNAADPDVTRAAFPSGAASCSVSQAAPQQSQGDA